MTRIFMINRMKSEKSGGESTYLASRFIRILSILKILFILSILLEPPFPSGARTIPFSPRIRLFSALRPIMSPGGIVCAFA